LSGESDFTEPIEEISAAGELFAYIVRSHLDPAATQFLTPPDLNLQAGFVVVGGGQQIPRHDHKQTERRVIGTAEAIFVRKGRCYVDIYSADRELIATRELRVGDMSLFVRGGHGFRAIEETLLFEIKQGPYLGLDDKERF
jgi:hypothetical protein